MKKIVILIGVLVMLISFRVAFGQQEGVITYEVKFNMHRNLPEDRQQAKAMIPEFRITKQQLFFNSKSSLYKPLIEEDDDEETEVSGGGMHVRMRTPNIELYSNSETGEMLSKQEFFGKNYLIHDTIKIDPWKMGTETKTIMGYPCQQAYYNDEERKQIVTAWFTNQLRASMGPDRFQTLPGGVLALDINNGERTMVAIKVELRELKKNELKIPSTGIPISRIEFRKMVDEQMKKMGGKDGRIIIRN